MLLAGILPPELADNNRALAGAHDESRQSRLGNQDGTGRLKFWKTLLRAGPGLVTGASDDDPSGIATYAQAGAQFGLGVLWMAVFSYPLMCAVQEISARIGRVTGRGISANLRKNYPRPVVMTIVLLLLVSSIFNL